VAQQRVDGGARLGDRLGDARQVDQVVERVLRQARGGTGHGRQAKRARPGPSRPIVRSMADVALVTAGAAAALLLAAVVLLLLRRAGRGRPAFGTVAERATYAALHEASLAAPPLREGLTADAAARSARHLRTLLGSTAVSLTDTEQLLAWDGDGEVHSGQAHQLAAQVLQSGRAAAVGRLTCGDPDCTVRSAVVAPLVLDERVVGTLGAYGPAAGPALVAAVGEVARWVSGQLELAELDESRSRLAEAQVRALRAQISPHFIFNALTAIASFVRTDPDRARDLLLDFADFTRYASRTHGEFTTLAEELRSIDRYLLLERPASATGCRWCSGSPRRCCRWRCPTSACSRWWRTPCSTASSAAAAAARSRWWPRTTARSAASRWRTTAPAATPETVRRALAGTNDPGADGHRSIGLGNVDARLRAVYGDDHGLVVETAEGAGTKVTVRVPKFASGVRPRSRAS
jgi:two-component system LytT family sensor kinase